MCSISLDSTLAKEYGNFFGHCRKKRAGILKRGKGKNLSFPSYVVISLTMAEQCKRHTFVNTREKASSKTMKNVYAKLLCSFFPHMMYYVLAGKEYGASVAMIYLRPCTLMVKRNKTLAVHSNIICHSQITNMH